ncbi:type II secretion protein F [Georgenia sp. 10Sc9-8]|uniref:Type II secretion protein F n=1 Tax=Georgenia halotolerans TaxID=3028317 RepID=A0ABT5TZF7_9MICO|nr:type II secretion protein F [Georgenia halotolerans]
MHRPSWRRLRATGHRRQPDLGALTTEVAARLRAGADVETAWATAWRRRTGAEPTGPLMGPDGVPAPLHHLAAARGGAVGAVPGTVAACRLTHELGAPLAPVLEQCATGIAESDHAHRARAVALAGPRSTARLLGALPVLGLLLGGVVGADPVAVLLDGGVGTACLLAGLTLLALGHWWTARLTRAAEGDGAR